MNREGKLYKVINGDHDFDKGDTLVLVRDDGDEIPLFRSENTGHTALMKLDDLEEIKLKKRGKKMKLKVGAKYEITGNGSGVTHFFEKGEIVTLTHVNVDYSGKLSEFVNSKGVSQTVSHKDVKKVKKPLAVGSKAKVISRDKTRESYGLTSDMADVGDKIAVKQIDGNCVTGVFNGRTYSYHIEDLKGGKKKTEKAKPAKAKIENGDIVRILDAGSSCNEVGDIGVAVEVCEDGTLRVEVPNKPKTSNWVQHDYVEVLGLKGEIK